MKSQLQVYEDRLFDDPVFFTHEIFNAMGWDKFAPLDWAEEDMVFFMATGKESPHAKEYHKFTGALGWRSLGKTHLVTCCISCWDLYRDPDSKIVIVSKSLEFAKKAKKLIRDVIAKVDFLRHLMPRTPTRDREWADNDLCFDVGPSKPSKDPSVWAVGIDGQLPGSRASRLIADDVETPSNTITFEQRNNLQEKVKEFKFVASYGQQRVNYVGTYHHEQSLYLVLMKRGYVFRSYPIMFPAETDRIEGLSPAYLARLRDGRNKPGDIASPNRITAERIAELKAEGRHSFAMQCMLIADLGDENRYPLKLSDLIVFSPTRDKAPAEIIHGKKNGQGHSTCLQEIAAYGFGADALYGPILFSSDLIPFQGTKMWVDPAGKGADGTGFAIVSFANGMLYVKACGSDHRGHSVEVMHRLSALARLHKVNDIRIEDFGLQSMFKGLMEPVLREYFVEANDKAHPDMPDGWRCSIDMQRPKNGGVMKELRIIQALEPLMTTHRLVVAEDVIRSERLQKQITRLCAQRGCLDHDDEVEALANACQLWEDYLGATQEQAKTRATEEAFMKRLREYAGEEPKEPAWFTHR